MECLIFAIIIVVIIASASKSGSKKGPVQNTVAQRPYEQRMQTGVPGQMHMSQYTRPAQPQQRAITPEERARLEEYKRRKATAQASGGAPIRPSQPNYVSNHSRTVEQPDIVARAKQNVSAIENEQENVEVALAQPMDVKSPINKVETGPHSDVCIRSTHAEAVEETESMLGTVEDLIVMGYSGDLSGMRDFQAEADAMLNSYIL